MGVLIMVIELTPQEQKRVLSAQARGVDVNALIRSVIAGLPDDSAQSPGMPHTVTEVDPSPEDNTRGTTSDDLNAFLTRFAELGRGRGYLRPEAFNREGLYEDRL